MSERSSTDKLEVLMAVDFGTTFSGLCWALKEKPNDHNLVQNWPGEGASRNKAPTTLLYNKQDGSHRWGYQIRNMEPRHEWFKLGLYPTAERKGLGKEYPSKSTLSPQSPEEYEKLVIDYLTDLRKHAEDIMRITYGDRLLSRMSMEYIITVPAVWDDKPQSKTQYCAQKAGMGNHVQIITEPEAAGIYALASFPTIGLKQNDTFILCDAGGGTVDLVSYTISKLEPIPKLVEAARGEGGLCGSIFLNRIFAKYLDNKLGRYEEWDEEYQADALKCFEEDIKKNFSGDVNETLLFPARGLNRPELGIWKHKLRISGQDVKDVFDRVIEHIIPLVTEQIRKTANAQRPVTAVLMAGGFGSSRYLQARIQQAVGTHIRVRQVPNNDTAVVRGALMRGLAKKDPGQAFFGIESRVARRHYGTMAYQDFIQGTHKEILKEPKPYGVGHIVPAMWWFIEKNTNVEDTKPVVTQKEFFWDKPVLEGRPTVIEALIFVSEEDTPPVHPGEHTSEILKIQADISSVPKNQFAQVRGAGRQSFYKIPYQIEATILSGSITFTILYRGKRYEASKEFL